MLQAALYNNTSAPQTLLEAHGTGTALGDPIEVSAISTVLTKKMKSCKICLISGIKGNTGHMESTAGVVNITKIMGFLC